MTITVLGWVAAGVFTTSYLFRKAETLTKIQAAAACLWIIYGLAIHAVPVVVTNLIVAGAALYYSFRRSRRRSRRESERMDESRWKNGGDPALRKIEPEIV
jgi:hypothetical protein